MAHHVAAAPPFVVPLLTTACCLCCLLCVPAPRCFVDAQEAAYQLEEGNLAPLRKLAFMLQAKLSTLRHESTTLTNQLVARRRQAPPRSEHQRLQAAIAEVSQPHRDAGQAAFMYKRGLYATGPVASQQVR